MSRPGYLNYKVTPKRQIWLAELCQRLGLNPNHKSYCDAIDTALAAMVAGVVERKEQRGIQAIQNSVSEV